MAGDKIRLLIVDDHERVRRELVAKLRRSPDLDVVGATGDGEEAVRSVAEHRPDVVLIDVKRDDGYGVELCRRLSHDRHEPVVVVLTSYLGQQEWEEARRAGAHAYLLKQIDSKALVARIKEMVREHASRRRTDGR
jgi:DNA-binding NarL/FixJ family response regulator